MKSHSVNLVYFSCGRDEDLLKISIESSRKNYKFEKIFVFSDCHDIVNTSGFDKDIEFICRTSGSEKLYGLKNIAEMHECFKIAAIGCDYILKKDSDILDCSDFAYKTLNENNFDCLGAFPMARENLIPKNHFNGNAYFIKSDVIQRFPEKPPEIIHNWKILNYPEDMVTSAICGTLTSNISVMGTAQNFDGLYLFDVFLSRVAETNPENIKKYGFAHCRTNLRIMEYLNNKIYENN